MSCIFMCMDMANKQNNTIITWTIYAVHFVMAWKMERVQCQISIKLQTVLNVIQSFSGKWSHSVYQIGKKVIVKNFSKNLIFYQA